MIQLCEVLHVVGLSSEKFQLQLADMGVNKMSKESSSSERTSEQFFRSQVSESGISSILVTSVRKGKKGTLLCMLETMIMDI